MPYEPESRPTKPQRTSTSADNPSTRSASPNAAGTAPLRNWPAVARHSANVTARPPAMTASLNRRGPGRPPIAPVTRGMPSVQTRRFTLALQVREAADVHRLEPVHDAMDEDAEDENGQDHVE